MFRLNKHLHILAIVLLAIIIGMLTDCAFPYTYSVENVPSYCQLSSHRCGAACAQMIIQFCCEKETPPVVPDWYDNLTSNQEHILRKFNDEWNGWMKDYHQTYDIPSPYKHPDAVKEAIMELKDGAPGHFVIFHDTDGAKVMHDMLYWMKEMAYPSATMKQGSHWVLVYGFITDLEPTMDNTVELEQISIIDPLCYPCPDPASGGNNVPDISPGGWEANYWREGVRLWSGKPYHGEYVAVVEPPVTKGRVKIKKAYVGKKEEIISVESAIKKVKGYVRERKLTEYRVLNFMTKASPQTPFLVEWPDNNRYYYLVPFAIEKGGPAKAVMILNPYNGNYQECGTLCRPISFVSREEAVRLTLKKVGIRVYKKLTTSLKYAYSNLTYSHYYPFWEIKVDGKLYYLDQNRKVHKKFVVY